MGDEVFIGEATDTASIANICDIFARQRGNQFQLAGHASRSFGALSLTPAKEVQVDVEIKLGS